MDASTFPIPFWYHLVFALVASAFFLAQFIRVRRPYQLILMIAMLSSLLIYVCDVSNKSWFHTVGIFEFVLLLGAAVMSIQDRTNRKKNTEAADADDAEETDDKDDDGDIE